MPLLLAFAVCEKVIIGVDHVASAIAFFDTINVNVPASEEIPQDAAIPIRWSTFTLLRFADDEIGKAFEQRIITSAPDGAILNTTETMFTPSGIVHRHVANSITFPIGQAGMYELVLELRNADGEDTWSELARYPVHVIHNQDEDPKSDGEAAIEPETSA